MITVHEQDLLDSEGIESKSTRHPPALRWNLFANIGGTAWSAFLGLILVPVYVRLLGIEAYGLIGFFATIQALSQVFDLGLSSTINREMARYSTYTDEITRQRSLAKTIEITYLVLGTIPASLIIGFAPSIASNWVRATVLSPSTIRETIILMGLAVFLQWPIRVYTGGMMGLEKQVLLNIAKILISTFSAIGVLIVLTQFSSTITAFFVWQIIIAGFQALTLRILFWRTIPKSHIRATFSPPVLLRIRHFVLGISAISIAGLILTQVDKVVLSKVVSLNQFGYYSLAGVIASGITLVLVSPTFNVFFPRFSTLVEAKSELALKRTYHLGSQVMTVLLIPIISVIVVYSLDILKLWSGSDITAQAVAPILRIMLVGTVLNGLMHIPYSLQLAFGWTRLALSYSLVFILVSIPLTILGSIRYGPLGAASIWAIQNFVYLISGVPLTHRKVLQGEAHTWFLKDLIIPGGIAVLLVLLSKVLWVGVLPPIPSLVRIIVVWLMSIVACGIFAGSLREKALEQVSIFWSK